MSDKTGKSIKDCVHSLCSANATSVNSNGNGNANSKTKQNSSLSNMSNNCKFSNNSINIPKFKVNNNCRSENIVSVDCFNKHLLYFPKIGTFLNVDGNKHGIGKEKVNCGNNNYNVSQQQQMVSSYSMCTNGNSNNGNFSSDLGLLSQLLKHNGNVNFTFNLNMIDNSYYNKSINKNII